MKKQITYINLIIILVLSTLIIYFIPSDTFTKYNAYILRQEKTDLINQGIKINYDLNNDNKIEKIIFLLNENSVGNILIVNENKNKLGKFWKTLGNHKFIKGEPRKINFINDYDFNGLNEIYYFTSFNDSLFLNILELSKNLKNIKFYQKKFITKLSFRNNKPDVWVNKIEYYDNNNDGYNEIIFSLCAGFSIQPRGIFIYDIKNNILKQTPKSSININDFEYIKDKNIIIITKINNTGNTISQKKFEKFKNATSKDSVNFYSKMKTDFVYEYGDFSSYTIVLDTNLNFIFPPIEYPGHLKFSRSTMINNNIYSLVIYPTDSSFIPYINSINLQGQIIKKIKLPRLKSQNLYLSKSGKNLAIQNYTTNRIFIFDTLLCLKKTICYDLHLNSPFIETNVDSDDDNEFISYNDNNIVIFKNDFNDKTLIPISYIGCTGFHLSVFKKNDGNFLNVVLGDTLFTIKYYKNKMYFLKYILYISIFAIVSLIILFVYYIQKKHLQKNYEKKKELNELQLITIKRQISPHFIFNALNSISSIVYKEEKEAAYNFITKFSSLIRATLIGSDKISRSLKEEINFVSNYLDLEKFRFKEKFDFKINIDERIDTEIQIPKMCIQTYAENAIKHGLMHKKTKGNLDINIFQKNKNLEINIIDNGIGRKKSKEQFSYSTGKGYVIMGKTFKLYKQLTKKEIKHIITDLYDNKGKSKGTLVKILLEN